MMKILMIVFINDDVKKYFVLYVAFFPIIQRLRALKISQKLS